MSRGTRKPLVVMSPKSMLRHPKAVSPIEDFETDTAFQEVIDDPKATAKKTKDCYSVLENYIMIC